MNHVNQGGWCMKALVLMLVAMLCPALVFGATYYVAPNGNNNTPCPSAQSASTPRQSITAGIGCLHSGDTLIVGSGTYVEKVNGNSIPNGTSNAPTVIRAAVQRQAILKPTNAGGGQIFYLGGGANKQWI